MLNSFITALARGTSLASRALNLGNGSTWPGHLALKLNRNFIKEVVSSSNMKVILVAGTNGKTTTAGLITHILRNNGHKVLQNRSGANLLNGIASSLILNKACEFAVFETDENVLPLLLKQIKPYGIVLLNLFRDQLDRYGEINIIASKWQKALNNLDKDTFVAACADDPQLPYILRDTKAGVYYFGLNDKSLTLKSPEHASDSIFCPKCSNPLSFTNVFLSHLGAWRCEKCLYQRPKLNIDNVSYYPVLGVYGRYDTLAGVLAGGLSGIKKEDIEDCLKTFKPLFGRQEHFKISGRNVSIFLCKNPASFNSCLRLVLDDNKSKTLLIVLNDRIPDGRDVSWIWDINMEKYTGLFKQIFVSGDRAFDMALRLKYANMQNVKVEESLSQALTKSLSSLGKDETLYVLPTYSAMLSVRKLLLGKSIL